KKQLDGSHRREATVTCEAIGEAHAGQQLHHQERITVGGGAHVEYADNPRMVQACAGPRLTHQAIRELGPPLVVEDDLDRDVGVEGEVACLPHRAHAAPPEGASQLVLVVDQLTSRILVHHVLKHVRRDEDTRDGTGARHQVISGVKTRRLSRPSGHTTSWGWVGDTRSGGRNRQAETLSLERGATLGRKAYLPTLAPCWIFYSGAGTSSR